MAQLPQALKACPWRHAPRACQIHQRQTDNDAFVAHERRNSSGQVQYHGTASCCFNNTVQHRSLFRRPSCRRVARLVYPGLIWFAGVGLVVARGTRYRPTVYIHTPVDFTDASVLLNAEDRRSS
eukprot:4892841-Prymnesium_polylepis.2